MIKICFKCGNTFKGRSSEHKKLHCKKFDFFGESLTIDAICQRLNIPRSTYKAMKRRNGSHEITVDYYLRKRGMLLG
jgi:hypothetical protein